MTQAAREQGASGGGARLERQVGAPVELRHVSKRYGAVKPGQPNPGAVNDLSLRVEPGEICTLVGPSGCGKTTTLKMVNRLVEPTSGEILIDGRNVRDEDPNELRRRIGYVIQQTGLFPHKTVADNIATVPQLLGWSRERIRQRVDDLLELIGLDPASMRRRYPSELSGGERQRVGVARALAAEPPVMLMDEPFGAVDPIVRARLQDDLLRLHERLGMTVLFVTHDIDEAIKMGSRVAVMEEGGVLAQYAPPSELLLHPASPFVARFVGVDRGLKRLALLRVADVALADGVTVREGEPMERARAGLRLETGGRALVLDGEERPVGWLGGEQVATGGVVSRGSIDPLALTVTPATSLRDGLSAALASPAQTAVVVDAAGQYRGLLTLASLGQAFRSDTGESDDAGPAAG